MADQENKTKSGTEGGVMGFIIAVMLIALLGAGAGFVMAPRTETSAVAKHDDKSSTRDAKAAHGGTHGADGKSSEHAQGGAHDQVIPLDPILVNISGLEGRWVRVEGAVAFTTPPKDDRALLLKQMAEDLLAYLRTVTLAQISSSSGLEYTRDDLSEVVRIRSNGRARAFILRTLVVE